MKYDKEEYSRRMHICLGNAEFAEMYFNCGSLAETIAFQDADWLEGNAFRGEQIRERYADIAIRFAEACGDAKIAGILRSRLVKAELEGRNMKHDYLECGFCAEEKTEYKVFCYVKTADGIECAESARSASFDRCRRKADRFLAEDPDAAFAFIHMIRKCINHPEESIPFIRINKEED